MIDSIREAMKSIEDAPDIVPSSMDPEIRFAALAGLGSKYLAVGTPMSIGLINFTGNETALIECHTLLFGKLEVLRSDELGIEEAMAADIICLPSSADFDLDWIAEATHLNILDDGCNSSGTNQLAKTCALTYLNAQSGAPGLAHGLLADVIRGSVSGRVGEEITALVACETPEHSAEGAKHRRLRS